MKFQEILGSDQLNIEKAQERCIRIEKLKEVK